MDFESLLIQEKERKEKLNTKEKKETKIQKADKGTTLFGFIKMLNKICKLYMPEIEFVPDEGKVLLLDAVTENNNPFITYQVVSRTTSSIELKPRIREIINEKTEDGENILGEVWGQKFECIIQFNIFSSVYSQAEEVMENFEEIIFKHTGFFKKNGVVELIFDSHITDSHFDTLRESLSIRSLRYKVDIEKLTVLFKEKIKEIEILAQNKNEEEGK